MRATSTSHPPASRGRLRALAAAVRLAWIPIACAVVLAIAGGHPQARALVVALLLPALGLGLAAHAREIFTGRR